MSIKIINKWIVLVFTIFSILTFLSLWLANYYRNEQVKILDVQLKSLMLSDQLSEGSDFLTNTVRAFSVTGDPNYDDLFAEEVNIKRSRDKAVDGLRKLGATSNELALIEKAKRNSDKLINLENEAFKAGRSGKLELASKLVYGPTYLSEKAKIMGPIHDFQKDIALRLADEVKEISWRADTSLLAAFIIVFTMVLIVFLSQVLFYGRRVVRPLVCLNEVVSDLTIEKRDSNFDIFNDSSEISTLAKSINSFHSNAIIASDFQKIKLHIAELSSELYKAKDLVELTEIVMTDISSFLGVRYGLLYIANQEQQSLELIGGYGVPIQELGKKVLFGESLVGQCALNKAPVLMSNPPKNYVRIYSSIGSALANCILIQPLILNKRLLGVIELAAFRKFDDNDQAIIAEISLALAMSIELLKPKEA